MTDSTGSHLDFTAKRDTMTAKLASSQRFCPKPPYLFTCISACGLKYRSRFTRPTTSYFHSSKQYNRQNQYSLFLNALVPFTPYLSHAIGYLEDETHHGWTATLGINKTRLPRLPYGCIPKQCFHARLCGGRIALGVPSAVQGVISGGQVYGIRGLR